MNDIAQLFYMTLGCELFLGGLWLLCNLADRADRARIAAAFEASARLTSRLGAPVGPAAVSGKVSAA